MEKKGTAEQEAEVDTVYSGSFKNFAESISKLSEVIVGATCTKVKQVLVAICSDSRLVAMKLYQIEIQSCLVKRQGYLVDMADQRQMLTWNETGFAIIFNRAALQIDTKVIASEFGLTNVQCLLEEKKLHIAYFQSEAALPAALSMAREAEKKAGEADKKAAEADKKAAEADKKAAEADKKAAEADNNAAKAIQELRQLKDELQGEGLFSVP